MLNQEDNSNFYSVIRQGEKYLHSWVRVDQQKHSLESEWEEGKDIQQFILCNHLEQHVLRLSMLLFSILED